VPCHNRLMLGRPTLGQQFLKAAVCILLASTLQGLCTMLHQQMCLA
jgi:hypothetical protein